MAEHAQILHAPVAAPAAHAASRGGASWYLDPLAAEQKRRIHQELVRRWTGKTSPQTVLKTDLFEEANGADWILFDLFPGAEHVVGMDIESDYVTGARGRAPLSGFSFVVTDVRATAFPTGSFDVVISNSTLDHFETREDLRAALKELVRVLRPGGTLIVTLDNPANPLYAALRWMSRRRWAPFSLGQTASQKQLNRWLEEFGLQVTANDWLIHNPRIISTGIFLALRRMLGRYADGPIRALLALFALSNRFPTRRFSACFVAARAQKAL